MAGQVPQVADEHGGGHAHAQEQGEKVVADMVTASNKFALECLITALFVLIGLAWETCFYTANYEIVDHNWSDYREKAMARAIGGGGMCLVMGPAWVWYVIPNSFQGRSQQTASERWAQLRNANQFVRRLSTATKDSGQRQPPSAEAAAASS
eukprot:SRR837773.11124.p1 GENE.SRR837773.11124~~SRR837773.11124.p1  ORF type:complete len:170 (+),score=28.33 SRR837773.11124:56-511(+)